jgi:putative holliday junction resolvase
MRYLGVDVGEKRVGVAISDPDGQFAVPLRTLVRTEPDGVIDEIAALVAEEHVVAVIVGLPLSLDGTVGPQAESVQEFVRQLLPAVSVPVVLWDERLSTVQAEELLRRGGRTARRSRKDKGVVDTMAATVILQDYLDGRSRPPGERR